MKIDREAFPFFSAFAIVSAAMIYISRLTGLCWTGYAGWVSAVLGLYTLYFFRDPERVPPPGNDSAVSAADGVVVDVSRVESERLGAGTFLRIAVFMNVFNVHVNRAPLDGTVTGTEHRPGKKLSAYNKRAEYENEYGDTILETPRGVMLVRQIAGLVARRVVGRTAKGDVLERGQRIGLIRFGSRVDVFLPEGFVPRVENGQKVTAGVTVIAEYENELKGS